MAQRPTADYPIDANTTSGTDLSLILNRFQTALESGNSGSSRPAYITAGGLWVKEGDPMELYLYDGTTDQLLYDTSNGINVTEGLWTLVDENNEAGEIQRPSDVLIDGNLTVTGDLVDSDGNPISIIDPATEDGVVATWDNTAKQWTPDSSLTIDATGDATFSGDVHIPEQITFQKSAGNAHSINADTNDLVFTSITAGKESMRLTYAGNATFSGSVSVSDVTVSTGVVHRTLPNYGGVSFASSANVAELLPCNSSGSSTDGAMDIGRDNGAGQYRWRNAHFSGSVNSGAYDTEGAGCKIWPTGAQYWRTAQGPTNASDAYRLYASDNTLVAQIRNNGQFVSNGAPLTRTVDLIETLATLREATKDESTLEGLRDAIGDAIGGLIQKFEAIQAEAKEKLEEAHNQTGTQEITPDKGTKDDKPEAGTLDLEE